MAGIAKIASKNLDEVNKINTAVLIGLGDAAVAEVLAPKTFYAGNTALKTGIMPTVALAPGSSAYPTGYHAGDGGGLPAIDGDLAAGNIKDGVTIFNVLGTFAGGAMAHDADAQAVAYTSGSESMTSCETTVEVLAGATVQFVTTNITVIAGAFVVGAGCNRKSGFSAGNTLKMQLFIDGVEVAEGAFIDSPGMFTVVGYKASLSAGVRAVAVKLRNYAATTSETTCGYAVMAGSVKT